MKSKLNPNNWSFISDVEKSETKPTEKHGDK